VINLKMDAINTKLNKLDVKLLPSGTNVQVGLVGIGQFLFKGGTLTTSKTAHNMTSGITVNGRSIDSTIEMKSKWKALKATSSFPTMSVKTRQALPSPWKLGVREQGRG